MAMLTCRETSRLLSEGADRYLTLRERLGVRLHLWMCAPCRRFEAQLRWLREAVGRQVTRNEYDASVGYADLPPALRVRIQAVAAECTSVMSVCKKNAARND